MRKTLGVVLFCLGLWALAQAAPFSTSTPLPGGTPPPPTSKVMIQPCFNTNGGFGFITPCTANATVLTTGAVTTQSTTVFRFQPSSNSPAPPTGQTQVVVSLPASNIAITMNNACVCSGSVGSASAWNCATNPTRILCGGANNCSLSTTASKALDPLTFPWNTTMMMFAFDFSATSGFTKVGINTSASPINYSTTGGVSGTNTPVGSFNTWTKNSVQEACVNANLRTTSYSTNGTNFIYPSKIVAQ